MFAGNRHVCFLARALYQCQGYKICNGRILLPCNSPFLHFQLSHPAVFCTLLTLKSTKSGQQPLVCLRYPHISMGHLNGPSISYWQGANEQQYTDSSTGLPDKKVMKLYPLVRLHCKMAIWYSSKNNRFSVT